MKEFSFLHNITIGQYLPTGSSVHRLHPATKILLTGVLLIALVISRSLAAQFVALGFILIAIAVARIPLRFAARGLRPAIPIIVLVAALQIFFSSSSDAGRVFWHGARIAITAGDFHAAGVTALRLVVLVLLISLFTLSTAVKELTHGTERLLQPLSRIGFPGHELAMVMTIALRFLPVLATEAERLVKAQMSRGADFGKGRMGLFKRVFRMMPLFVPLFLASLRRGESMALAMEARCYAGGKGRTHLIRFQSGTGDTVAAAIVGLVSAAVLVMHFLQFDQFLWSQVI